MIGKLLRNNLNLIKPCLNEDIHIKTTVTTTRRKSTDGKENSYSYSNERK